MNVLFLYHMLRMNGIGFLRSRYLVEDLERRGHSVRLAYGIVDDPSKYQGYLQDDMIAFDEVAKFHPDALIFELGGADRFPSRDRLNELKRQGCIIAHCGLGYNDYDRDRKQYDEMYAGFGCGIRKKESDKQGIDELPNIRGSDTVSPVTRTDVETLKKYCFIHDPKVFENIPCVSSHHALVIFPFKHILLTSGPHSFIKAYNDDIHGESYAIYGAFCDTNGIEILITGHFATDGRDRIDRQNNRIFLMNVLDYFHSFNAVTYKVKPVQPHCTAVTALDGVGRQEGGSEMPTAFISYSWDSDGHKSWVRDLASRLRSDGVDVTLDQWHLVPGDQLPQFMERAVRDREYILIVCTRRYKQKSDLRVGGVGYEGDIMSSEVFTERNQRKFIPILREPPWADSAPSWLLGKYYVDLSESPYSEIQYQDLLSTLLGTRPQAPPVGNAAHRQPLTASVAGSVLPAMAQTFDPIKITGVVIDQVGTPRGDGTRGSALYRVPFRLSRRPPPLWAELFPACWDHPPRFSSMHRPGIASVVGDLLILDGTTVEEVQQYHRDTLILAVEETNNRYVKTRAETEARQEEEAKRIADHKRHVEEQAKTISFDDSD